MSFVYLNEFKLYVKLLFNELNSVYNITFERHQCYGFRFKIQGKIGGYHSTLSSWKFSPKWRTSLKNTPAYITLVMEDNKPTS